MLATLAAAREEALQQPGSSTPEEALGISRLRPWAVDFALARYEEAWLREEEAGVAGWGGQEELRMRSEDAGGNPAPAASYASRTWVASRKARKAAKRRFHVAMQSRWGWEPLRLFMAVGFVDGDIFAGLTSSVQSRIDQDEGTDSDAARACAAATAKARRLRRRAAGVSNEARRVRLLMFISLRAAKEETSIWRSPLEMSLLLPPSPFYSN